MITYCSRPDTVCSCVCILSMFFRHLHRSICTRTLYPYHFAPKSFSNSIRLNLDHRSFCFSQPRGVIIGVAKPIVNTMHSTSSISAVKQVPSGENFRQNGVLDAKADDFGGVIVEIEESMDAEVFAPLLRSSISKWREEGKKGVWIKLPLGLANLVEAAVKEGFWYHHAEADYLMLIYWIPESGNTLPANASHRVGIGAFVINSERKVLVVQERYGRFKGTGVWKLPTGVINEGEDIIDAACREVKEETGIDTEFVEVLAFSQSHKSPAIFGKSDLFFVCMLRPLSLEIEKQDSEIEAAQWLAVEDYVSQPFVQTHEHFKYIADLCLEKLDKDYAGFTPLPTKTSSGKISYLYLNRKSSS